MKRLQSLDRSGDSPLSTDRPTEQRMRHHAKDLIRLAAREMGDSEKLRFLSKLEETYGRSQAEIHALIASGRGTGAEESLFQALQRFADDKFGKAPKKQGKELALAET